MRTILLILACYYCASCNTAPAIDDEKAQELVRLNYRQQNQAGEGKWTILTISVDSIREIKKDAPIFNVFARVNGLYRSAMADTSQQYTEQFYDTLQFTARKVNKVWMANEWTVLGSRHE